MQNSVCQLSESEGYHEKQEARGCDLHPSLAVEYSADDLTHHSDQNDESLNRWKASLGISNSPVLPVDPSDKRRCIIRSLALEVEGREDMTIDLTAPGSVEALKTKPFTIKEGAQFRMKANFKVQHDVLSGLKYLQVVKRKGIRVGKDEEMIVHSPAVDCRRET